MESGISNPKSNLFWLQRSLILIVLLVATWLRLWRLSELPPGFYYDEAYNALDGLWMRDTLSPQAYFVGDTGRHAMMPYLLAAALTIWGTTPVAARLVAPWVGVLVVALLYRLGRVLLAAEPRRRWLALVAAAGLALSMWHVVMSRTAYEATLVPFFVVLTLLLYWLGWQRHSWRYYVGAGVALGLSQYSYVSARLLPLIFVFFVIIRTVAEIWSGGLTAALQPAGQLRRLWGGLLLMAAATFIVFLPLGWFIWNDPVTYFFRSRDVFVLTRVAQGELNAADQLIDSLRLLVDGYSPTWRHNIVGRPGFNWLYMLGFGLGLVLVCKRFRQPRYQLLLVALLVTWLPAPLSSGISTLRMSGLLPVYYLTAAVGLLAATGWIAARLPWPRADLRLDLSLIGLILIINGGSTAYAYFWQWASEPEVYHAYAGPQAEFAQQLVERSATVDFLLPFELYVQPTIRFGLYGRFAEIDQPPATQPDRPLYLATMSDAPPTSLVWLTRDKIGRGLAYITPVLTLAAAQAQLAATGPAESLQSAVTDDTIGLLTPLANSPTVLASLTNWQSINPLDFTWDHQLRLFGYEVVPAWVQPGQSPLLNLYWRSLVGQPHTRTQFIQLVNWRGEAVGQWTDTTFADQHRWRTGGTIPDQHVLWLSPDIPPGPYLVRLGLFDYSTGRRMPIYGPAGQFFGDYLVLGLFYVAESDRDPRLPEMPLPVQLGDRLRLLGYSRPPVGSVDSAWSIRLHWQAIDSIATDYTVFVQLLDQQGRWIAGWDSPPLAGQYPTSRWQPGEVVVDRFELAFPPFETLPPGKYRLVTGLYDPVTGLRVPAVDSNGQPLPDNMIILHEIKIP